MASGPAERARLLGLTCDYLLTHGMVGVSLSELARGIGSNNRMLLYHFNSLDEILATAVDEIVGGTALISQLAELLATDTTSAQRVGAAWRHVSDPERLHHLRIFFARFGMVSDTPQRYAEFLDRTRDEWTDTVTAALARDPGIEDARTCALGIVGLWRGLQVLLISGEPRAGVDAAHDRTVAALLTDG
jgi:AcrR family transcriptional regulator